MKVKVEEGNCDFEGEYSYSEVEGLSPKARWYLYLRNPKTFQSIGLAFYPDDKDELDRIISDLKSIRESFDKKKKESSKALNKSEH